MIVMGIDPGPEGWAWAVYSSEENKFIDWDDDDTIPTVQDIDYIAIEDIVSAWQRGNPLIQTAKMIGRLEHIYPDAIMIPRKEIAVVLGGSVRAGDKEINAALGRLVPSFAAKRAGLNGHHRAAAAVAYVAVGKIRERELLTQVATKEGE